MLRIRGAEYLEPNITLRRFVKRKSGKKHDMDNTRLENQRVAMEDVREAPLDESQHGRRA
jgi:hypothetical protein